MNSAKVLIGCGKWLFFGISLCLSITSRAQEATLESAPESDIEIDLDALDALSPDREIEPQAQPDQPADILAPPNLETDISTQPPPLTPPVRPESTGPQPQSPMAPRMTDEGPAPGKNVMSAAPIGESFTILFDEKGVDLSLQAAETLDKIARLANQSEARIQLFGYAGDKKSSPSTTRRLALRRTVGVRGYLMDQGVDGTRIDLRPQGPRTEDGPREAVVIKFLEK